MCTEKTGSSFQIELALDYFLWQNIGGLGMWKPELRTLSEVH
jgi:hypothetical protein